MKYRHKDIHDAYDEGYAAALREQEEWMQEQNMKSRDF